MTRRLLPLLLVTALAALAAPGTALAQAPAQPEFSVSPENPDVNQTVSLSITNPDSDRHLLRVETSERVGGSDTGADTTTSFDTAGR